jgi:hypothetical protein
MSHECHIECNDSKTAILGPLGITDKPPQRGASLLNTSGAHLEVLVRSGTGIIHPF